MLVLFAWLHSSGDNRRHVRYVWAGGLWEHWKQNLIASTFCWTSWKKCTHGTLQGMLTRPSWKFGATAIETHENKLNPIHICNLAVRKHPSNQWFDRSWYFPSIFSNLVWDDIDMKSLRACRSDFRCLWDHLWSLSSTGRLTQFWERRKLSTSWSLGASLGAD